MIAAARFTVAPATAPRVASTLILSAERSADRYAMLLGRSAREALMWALHWRRQRSLPLCRRMMRDCALRYRRHLASLQLL